jgi:hypothetical protein
MSRTIRPVVKSAPILLALCALLAPGTYVQDPPSRVARLNYIGGHGRLVARGD